MATAPAVFLDHDGTLVRDVPHDRSRIEFAPGALEGVQRLAETGLRLVVTSNESSPALSLQRWLRDMFAAHGVEWAGIYGPGPGLLLRAAQELSVDLERSWCIGDALDHVEAGRRAGCRTVLVDNGNETEWHLSSMRTPDFLAADLGEAADLVAAYAAHSCRAEAT
jgi:D-glycero-D-manno-heptose 1,7-bisphosphate phosphatase